jgi:vitamin B12 transporter
MNRAILLPLIMATAPAAAQDAPIIVTGRPLPAARGEAAYGAVTIGGERLALNASGRIEDVLGDVAGFAQFRRTDSRAANPSSQGATLRALGGNAASRALVLVDGVPVADPFTGFIAYSALRPERFARAAITRGGGAGAFGAGAVAGTIALDSGGPDTLPALSARIGGGSFGASEMSGGMVRRLGAGFASVQGGWDRGDGYRLIRAAQRGPADLPARYDAWSVALRAVAPLSPATEVQMSALIFDDHRLRGAAGTASRSRGADASLRIVTHGRWGVEALAYLQERGFRSGFVAFDAARAVVTPTLNQFATPAVGLGGKIELRPPVGPGRSLRIGADVRRASGRTNEFFRFQNGAPTRLRRAGGVNTTGGLFVEGGADVGALTLTGGVRVDRWRIASGFLTEHPIGGGAATLDQNFADRAGTEVSTRGGAVLALGGGFAVRAAAYTGFRVPTLNELYRPFRVGADATAANAALDLERLRGLEAGATMTRGRTRFGLTVFGNRLAGAIANVSLGTGPGNFPQVGVVAAGGDFRQRLNVDAIVVRGIEATAFVPLGRFTLSASYAFSDARVRASGAAVALNGKRPAQSPLHSGSATLSFASPALSAATTLRYAGARFDDDLAARLLPAALTVDTLVAVPLTPQITIVARAENLFNARIVSGRTASGLEDLGTPRTLWLGLRFAH